MPATIEEIRVILQSSEFSEAEKEVVKWQFNLLGNFHAQLWRLIASADDDNLELIEKGFPMQVYGYRLWAIGDLAQRLRRAGLQI